MRLAAIGALAIGLPLAGCASGAGTGAAGGAVAGAAVGGPVGAVVGGVTGAAVGAALTPDETTRVRTYVVAQRHPSVRVRDEVVVGYPLPRNVRLYPVPASVGLSTEYRYAVVNNRRVLVEPDTREVVYIIQ
ncbi:DUF1236 domain-containing protein [Alsobacter ponti]